MAMQNSEKKDLSRTEFVLHFLPSFWQFYRNEYKKKSDALHLKGGFIRTRMQAPSLENSLPSPPKESLNKSGPNRVSR